MSDQLFIAPCPPTWTPEEIKALFEQVGPVKQVKRPRDHTGKYRKFAFVTMASPELAAAAIERLCGIEIEGWHLLNSLAEKAVPTAAKPQPAAQLKAEVKPEPAPQRTAASEFVWEQRQASLAQVLENPGTATTVKITVVGRPGRVEVRGQTVIVSLAHRLKPAGYPKGVPAPPGIPTPYVVFIGAKQWKKVAEAIENPEDALIIEGQALLDAELSRVMVFATNVNTRLLQQASRPKATDSGESSG